MRGTTVAVGAVGMDGRAVSEAVGRQIERAVVGKSHVTRLLLTALVADGHVLLVDVPGVAKTRLARSLARLTELTMGRVQGTPDLLPQDITGGPIYDLKNSDLVFRPGPVFHNILLVDEINRTSPRTQAALLECMEERQVTADGVTHPLPDPFMVIATQNPIEMEGTFPLPEAELDRFLLSISLGYPDESDERRLIDSFSAADPLSDVTPVLSADTLRNAAASAQMVTLNETIRDYLVAVCRKTRNHPLVALGASPRATVRYAQVARTYAWLHGRTYVTPDDIKLLAVPVLAHRLVPSSSAAVSRLSAKSLVDQILDDVPVPVEDLP